MKQYKVVLSTATTVKTEDGFLTSGEAKRFLHSLGFRWCKLLNKWEQTFMNVDPFSDEDTWTGAAVVTESLGV